MHYQFDCDKENVCLFGQSQYFSNFMQAYFWHYLSDWNDISIFKLNICVHEGQDYSEPGDWFHIQRHITRDHNLLSVCLINEEGC